MRRMIVFFVLISITAISLFSNNGPSADVDNRQTGEVVQTDLTPDLGVTGLNVEEAPTKPVFKLSIFIKDLLVNLKLGQTLAEIISLVILFVLFLIVSIIVYLIVNNIILRIVKKIIKESENKYDDILLKHKLFDRIDEIIPFLIFYLGASQFDKIGFVITKLSMIAIIILGLRVINSVIDILLSIYKRFDFSKEKPITGYIQIVKAFFYIMGAVTIIALLINKSPWAILGSLGAMTAVIMLVFKDSILGLVASIQLAANDSVRIGDWITIPKYNADGDVIEMKLNSIKVQNFDKTIVTVPIYALISGAFTNWRGMQESGGRRIKRSLYIDMSTISFCSPDMLDRLEKIRYIGSYIKEKRAEIEQYNKNNKLDPVDTITSRQLTNIGVFRKYIELYLQNHESIHKNFTLLVRQLSPGENGLPLQIYTFTNTTSWAVYEGIQSDIFDHLLAIIHHFGLKVYQNPTGNDFKSALTK